MIHLTTASPGYTAVTITYGKDQYVVMTDEVSNVGADLHIADGIRLKEWIREEEAKAD